MAAGYVGPEVLATTTAGYYDQRIAWIREAAGDRFGDLELQCLTFLVQIVPDRRDAVERLADMMGVTPEQVDGTPIALVGTIERIGERLVERRRAVRVLLHRRPRSRDGGVRPGGGGTGGNLT